MASDPRASREDDARLCTGSCHQMLSIRAIVNFVSSRLRWCTEVFTVGTIIMIVPVMGCRYGDTITHDATVGSVVKSHVLRLRRRFVTAEERTDR